MKALSIQQPWAWAILNGKDIENRSWYTPVRGRILIHAGKKLDYDGVMFLQTMNVIAPKNLPLGGIVGSVELVDCVTKSDSPWFFGKYGFVLKNPVELPFVQYRGQLGFFDVPGSLISAEKYKP